MIRLDNVKKIYGKGEGVVFALNGVTLEIKDGQFVAIVGKSGSGKSTLLNMIGALDTPTEGKIFNGDKCLNDLNASQLAEYRNKNLGYIFQAFYLEPSFTVIENVEMPLMIAGVGKAERRKRALEIIKKVNLEDKTYKKVNTLSGGQKQRVSIARALVSSPNLVLADEPTGNLDSKNGSEIMALLRTICDEGKTVVLVTHNREDAQRADIIIEISDGKIVSIAETGGSQ